VAHAAIRTAFAIPQLRSKKRMSSTVKITRSPLVKWPYTRAHEERRCFKSVPCICHSRPAARPFIRRARESVFGKWRAEGIPWLADARAMDARVDKFARRSRFARVGEAAMTMKRNGGDPSPLFFANEYRARGRDAGIRKTTSQAFSLSISSLRSQHASIACACPRASSPPFGASR
jgi:hypothetical protein